ncbi:hypothetical protein HanRHA438_Chr10g0456351 [Helianthus annuus]|uniref:Uncharacterized protein n=1 Tax=Helianthus annuus TaxID=4232 RepID=A0A251TI53_HELAN|nr:hypothetical protein HanXRQr2_Chr10g0443941 [Helianthus annuus]KAJ0522106.1 hypothetical protein HanIR_Chr10g0478751 [Helianthus annuus]KAJ0743950.1 hypothetical protein HanPI659440_Chr10g0381851 [Helianthus annuus]KAJ0879855.1 hypothetical protein HanRHA438_Chr10g0456351 [Helianthus annuus]KAJ0884022.1 hypothetical protein HanPSC8_Chr10g0428621 [Helianthus annuus]
MRKSNLGNSSCHTVLVFIDASYSHPYIPLSDIESSKCYHQFLQLNRSLQLGFMIESLQLQRNSILMIQTKH